ncbi:MFS transporter [Acetobacter orientalis]|uniref:MFS transporter n=1 Tax=Acetobacter orientalis TaxID=146474 RepID=A0A2Z5ZJG3_9PROT|nr:MFS transporter [Acetobacter orientalis]
MRHAVSLFAATCGQGLTMRVTGSFRVRYGFCPRLSFGIVKANAPYVKGACRGF